MKQEQVRFRDRRTAGRLLAERVVALGLADPVVLALPRGGVPVAYEVAAALGAPLDVMVARKVGAPGHREYGIGAVAEGASDAVASDASWLAGGDWERLVAVERAELERRVRRYRGDRPLPSVTGRDAVLVDDGLATGVTAEAALRALREKEPRRLVLAVPVAAPSAVARLSALAEVVCVTAPESFRAVGEWYESFEQTTDDEVLALL